MRNAAVLPDPGWERRERMMTMNTEKDDVYGWGWWMRMRNDYDEWWRMMIGDPGERRGQNFIIPCLLIYHPLPSYSSSPLDSFFSGRNGPRQLTKAPFCSSLSTEYSDVWNDIFWKNFRSGIGRQSTTYILIQFSGIFRLTRRSAHTVKFFDNALAQWWYIGRWVRLRMNHLLLMLTLICLYSFRFWAGAP